MAQFIAGAEGNHQSVTRLGSKNSGVTAWAHGWTFGARVYMGHDTANDSDEVYITLNAGSGSGRGSIELGAFNSRDTLAEIAATLRSAADRIETIPASYGWPTK
jgi:hypothetical protein